MTKQYSVLSYHPNRSDGFGGIENLVRSFHELSKEMSFKFTELYNRAPNDIAIPINNDHKHKRIPLFFNVGLLSSINKSFNLWCEVRTQKHDLVLIYHPIHLLFFTVFNPKTKVILIQSNTMKTLFEGRVLSMFKKRLLKLCDLLVLYTEEDKKRLYDADDLPPIRTDIIPRACRLPIMHHKKVFNKKLVTICRIDEKQKNLTEMVQIVRDLPDWTLDIYGTGADEEVDKLRDLVDNISNIRFCGPSHNVAETLRHYSLFLMTSKHEGFGQTLIEARSQGLPQILYDTFDAAKSVVKDGETGFLIDYAQRDVFQQRIIQFETNGDLFSKMSLACLGYALTTESSEIKKMWKALFSYHMALQG